MKMIDFFLIEYQFRIKISIDREKEMSVKDYKKISFGFRPDIFLLIAPVGQPEDSYACRYDPGLSYAARKREIIFVSWNCQKKKNFL